MHDNQPKKAGELFSYDLFGNIKLYPVRENTARTTHVPTTYHSRTNHVPRTRNSRTTFEPSTENSRPVYAIWPYITQEAFANTMDNYRLFIATYNDQVELTNIETEKYNAAVRTAIASEPLTDVQKEFARIFKRKYASKRAKEYNELVEEFNTERGLTLEKKKIATVKYATEIVFQQMLHLYSSQLAAKTQIYMQLGITESQPVKKFEVNSYHVTSLERNGVKSIDVCTETIRNHRSRLEEAGVLTEYTFLGHKRGVKMHINSQILSIFDAKTLNFVGAENQRVSPQTSKEFGNTNDITRTIKKSIKIKENVKNSSLDLGTAQAPELLNSFLQEHRVQGEKISQGAAAENVKVSKQSSENLQSLILHDQELAEKLAAGEFNYHVPIDIRVLYAESRNGTMSRDDFQVLIIQEFMKCAARLYRSSTPFAGSWKKAINFWMQNKLKAHNGLYHKELMVDKLQEYRWRLNHAHKWFAKSEVNTLYPGNYFDLTRTDAKEIGFEYTRKAWLKHKKYQEEVKAKEVEVNRTAKQRKERINHAKKFDLKLKQFLNNRMTLNELIDYVHNNLPSNFRAKVSERLNQFSTKNLC